MKWAHKLLGIVLLGTGLTWSVSPTLAGNLSLATNALELVTGVEPNVFIIADNSGSMDMELLTPEAEVISGGAGAMNATVNADNYHSYFYVFGASDNVYNYDSFTGGGGVVPDEVSVAALANAEAKTAMTGLWRSRLYAYNKAYYNPDRTYDLWPGVDNSGTAFANASPTAARNNPYDAAAGTMDLTANQTVTTRRPKGTSEGTGTTTMTFTYYPAIYYVCTAADNTTEQTCSSTASNITATSGHKKVTVVSTTNSYTHSNSRTDCSTDNGNGTVTCTYAEEIQNFANWYSYHRRRELAAKAAIGAMVESAYAARVGFATINSTSTYRIAVASMNVAANTGNKKSLLDKVYGVTSTGGTDLLDALLKTGYYYQCASGDIMGSSSSSSPGNSACPVQADPAGKCEQNFAILLSDGYYTTTGDVPGSGNNENTDQDGASGVSSNYDGGAFADTVTNTMGDMAMYFYEQDLQSTLADEVPTTSIDRSRYPIAGSTLGTTMHQHMGLYTVGFGVSGSLSAMPTTPTSGFTWPDPGLSSSAKIDDMRHGAYNGRGSYLDATDPATLQDGLSDIFEEIMAGVGAASSVAFNTQEVESGSVVFRAFFNTKTNTGDLVSQDVNVDGSISDTVNWSAAEQLDSKAGASSDSRVILTYSDTGTSSSAGIPFQWNDLNAHQKNALHNPIPSSASNIGDERLGYLRGHTQYEGTNYNTGQFRARPSESGRLGDIVHSSPVFVGEPSFVGRDASPYPTATASLYSAFKTANEDRPQAIYAGANDGMMHAFSATSGAELFAYVPNALFSATGGTYPLSLFTSPDYTHRFYVDISPAINDVYIARPSESIAWRTVLVGGLGGGGKGYFALDITDPTEFGTEASGKSNVMWEFTEADDGSIGNSDLGYTYSRPVIAMTNAADASGNKRWAAIFGNGYNSTSSAGDAALYIVFLDGGEDGVWTAGTDYIKISTGNGKAESSDGSTPNGLGGVRAVDFNKTSGASDGTVDYVYAGDLQGNVYRFDISNTSTGQWTDNNMEVIFQAKYKATATIQPVTNTPVVVKHPSSGLIVILGTGRWVTTDDATSTDLQSIYGIWDDMSTTPLVLHSAVASSSDQLVEQVLTNQVTQVNGYTVRTLTTNDVTWLKTGPADDQVRGWVIDLDAYTPGTTTVQYPGERAIRNFQLRGDFVFVNTVIPKSSTACTTGPGGYEFAFDPITGKAPDTNAFDMNADGSFDDSDNVGGNSGSNYRVVGIRFDTATPSDAAFIGKMRVTQTSDQGVRTISTNTGDSGSTGRLSWREITP